MNEGEQGRELLQSVGDGLDALRRAPILKKQAIAEGVIFEAVALVKNLMLRIEALEGGE